MIRDTLEWIRNMVLDVIFGPPEDYSSITRPEKEHK